MKVLTYNINEGGAGRLAAIGATIAAQGPDAVALQEVTSRPAAAALARKLGMELVLGEANDGYHAAWLSRLPVLRWANYPLPALAKTLLLVAVPWAGTEAHLYATHLASRHDRQTPEGEVAAILEVLGRSATHPHLLVGDFNALRPGDPVGTPPPGVSRRGDAVEGAPRRAIGQLLEAGYTDCYRALHLREPGYTYPSAAPWLRLDHAFASPALAPHLRACDVVRGAAASAASDHRPLRVEFVPRGEDLT